jgi:nucleotide-binding universal stress UspA family protein
MDLEWIIATDLTPRSHGALRFAQWLHASAEPPGPRMTAVHVVNPRSSGAEYPGDAPVLARARELTRASVEAIGAATCFAAIEAIEGVRADEALAQLASSSGSGLIVGRAGEASTWSLVNLGPTARRLLRSVPGPLCVVPPDMHSIGDGPVLVAVSDAPHSEPAARFAIDLARSLHREVRALHIAPDPRPIPVTMGEPIMPPFLDAGAIMEIRDATRLRIERWLEEAGLPELSSPIVDLGDPGPAIERQAKDNGAAIIVCGSRRLGLRDRVLQSSIGTDLAAHADRPVIVVPPDFVLHRAAA